MSAAVRLPDALRASELVSLQGDVTRRLEETRPAWLADPREPKPSVLAFDPGAMTGWAALSSRHGYRGGSFPIAPQQLDEVLRWFVDDHTKTDRLLVVVEDCFLLKNVKTLTGLARNVGAVIALATLRDLPTWRVQPHAWQSAVLRTGGKRAPRSQGKAVSLSLARLHYGPRVENDHQADAAHLATYARGGIPLGARG